MKLKLKLNYKSTIVLGNILMAVLNLMPNPFPHKKTRISRSHRRKNVKSHL